MVGWEYEKSFKIIEEFAKWSQVPVINMEDNKYHPCQGMAGRHGVMGVVRQGPERAQDRCDLDVWFKPQETDRNPHHDFMYMASLFGADVVFSRTAGDAY